MLGGASSATVTSPCGEASSAPGHKASPERSSSRFIRAWSRFWRESQSHFAPVVNKALRLGVLLNAGRAAPKEQKMKNHATRHIFLVCLVMSLIFAAAAHAGPPLICHSIAIGSAQSLPWISEGWNLSGTENYDVKHLVVDTLAILNPSAPVLVRMETMRRATLYARGDQRVARQLLAKLIARNSAAETAGHPDALALFDAGYLAETYKQWLGKDSQNPAAGIDGYLQVKRATELRGEDPQMEFAAAMI